MTYRKWQPEGELLYSSALAGEFTYRSGVQD